MGKTTYLSITDQVSKRLYTVLIPETCTPAGVPAYYTTFDAPVFSGGDDMVEVKTRLSPLQIAMAIANGVPLRMLKPDEFQEVCSILHLYVQSISGVPTDNKTILLQLSDVRQAVSKIEEVLRRFVRHDPKASKFDKSVLRPKRFSDILRNAMATKSTG